MKLPRWTVYPALGLMAAMLVLAFPHPQGDRHKGAAQRSREDLGDAQDARSAAEDAVERDEADPAALEPQGPESD